MSDHRYSKTKLPNKFNIFYHFHYERPELIMGEILLIIWLGAVGAALGSFLNVVIYRLPRGESLVSPPSHCPKCNHKIRLYDNLPIFGWFLLGGQCRDCKQPISFRYPLIEIVTCIIVTTFACLIMPLERSIELNIVSIIWFAVLHLFLLTLGMIDFDRKTLKPLGMAIFLAIFMTLGLFFLYNFSDWEPLAGILVALTTGFLATKIIRINDHRLWLFAMFALGGFLGWKLVLLVLLATLPCHVAIAFVTRRSYAVLSLAVMSFIVTVWELASR